MLVAETMRVEISVFEILGNLGPWEDCDTRQFLLSQQPQKFPEIFVLFCETNETRYSQEI